MIAPRLPFDRVLYVARIGAEVTKIGSAGPRRVADRIRALSSQHKTGITVVALVPSTFQHETEAVRRFAALAVAGRREYFRDDGSIAAWVATLPAAHRCHIEHAYIGPKGKGPTARRHVPTITAGACSAVAHA